MGWIAGEEMDLCHSVTEEGMSTFEVGRKDGEKWMRRRKVVVEVWIQEGQEWQ